MPAKQRSRVGGSEIHNEVDQSELRLRPQILVERALEYPTSPHSLAHSNAAKK